MTERKVILFGGSFDPIHLAHITVANEAAKHICAEKVIFIPAKRSPLKDSLPCASDEHRLKMTALAIAEQSNFELSDYELKRSAPSYTLETVKKFQTDYTSQTRIYWLLGADAIGELQYWYKITELIDTCNLLTIYRAGFKEPDFTRFEGLWGSDRVVKLQRNVVPCALFEISSTEIRGSLAAGRDVTDLLCPAVAEYIYKHRLYLSKHKT